MPDTATIGKAPISPRKLSIIVFGAWIIYNVFYLTLWESLPNDQLILNRISWSSSDIVGITATSIALYSYWKFYLSTQSKDIQYIQELVLALKKAGIDPQTVVEVLAPMTYAFQSDPDFAKRFKRTMRRVAEERVEGLKRLREDELYELLRSGGLKL